MKNYVTFSDFPTPVNLAGTCGVYGVVNGYKLKTVLHSGVRIQLGLNSYFYLPSVNRIVTYRGSKAKELVIVDGKFNFIQKFTDRKGHWAFKPDAGTIYALANEMFN